MKIKLYSTGCPRCKVLKSKLDNKNIRYDIVSNVDTMTSKGIESVPVLEIDNTILDFKEAISWVNER